MQSTSATLNKSMERGFDDTKGQLNEMREAVTPGKPLRNRAAQNRPDHRNNADSNNENDTSETKPSVSTVATTIVLSHINIVRPCPNDLYFCSRHRRARSQIFIQAN